jgi:hypothetical protein
MWKMIIEDTSGNLTIYTGGSREYLEKILKELKIKKEGIKIEIKEYDK